MDRRGVVGAVRVVVQPNGGMVGALAGAQDQRSRGVGVVAAGPEAVRDRCNEGSRTDEGIVRLGETGVDPSRRELRRSVFCAAR